MRLCWQLYFPLEKKVNGKINITNSYYFKKKNFRQRKKVELGWITTTSRNGPISLKLIWFKLIWSCKHRIWYYNFWFRIYAKLIWPCISGSSKNKISNFRFCLIFIFNKKSPNVVILSFLHFLTKSSAWVLTSQTGEMAFIIFHVIIRLPCIFLTH